MNEDAMWRYVNQKPTYTVNKRKSCVGKSTYLDKEACYAIRVTDIDYYIWDVLETYNDKETIQRYKDQAKKIVYSNLSIFDKIKRFNNWFDVVLTEKFWESFFNFNYAHSDTIKLDWAAIGLYYNRIPLKYRSQCEFIELTCNEEERKKRIQAKGFMDKIDKLDELYQKPLIIDKTIDISTY